MPDPISSEAVAVAGTGLMAVLAAIGKWALGREVDRLDKTLESHGDSIDALEKDHVGKADVDRILTRLDDNTTRVVDRLEGKLDAVHARIDQVFGLPPRK